MSSSDFVVLAILPLTLWGGIVYVTRSEGKFAFALRASWSTKTKQELGHGARSWAHYALITFSIPLVVVFLWKADLIKTILSPSRLGRDIFQGVFLGLTLLGLLLIFRRHFPEARKFSLLVIAGAASPLLTRISVLFDGGFHGGTVAGGMSESPHRRWSFRPASPDCHFDCVLLSLFGVESPHRNLGSYHSQHTYNRAERVKGGCSLVFREVYYPSAALTGYKETTPNPRHPLLFAQENQNTASCSCTCGFQWFPRKK